MDSSAWPPSPTTSTSSGPVSTEFGSGAGVELDECSVEPVIAHFCATLKGIQHSELDRLFRRLPKLGDDSRYELYQFAERLVAQMVRTPLESLRDDSSPDSRRELMDAFRQLFKLNDT